LATITSEAENEFVYNLVSSDDRYWFWDNYENGSGPFLGGYQPEGSSEPSGGWTWITGETFSFTNSAAGEPNEGAGQFAENRLIFLSHGSLEGSTWCDTSPDAHQNGYIVEWEGSYSQ